MGSFRRIRSFYLKIGILVILCTMAFEVFVFKPNTFTLKNINTTELTTTVKPVSLIKNNLLLCKEFINNQTDTKVTDLLLKQVIQVCLQVNLTENDMIRNDHFIRLFRDEYFGHVTCSSRLIGRPQHEGPIIALANVKGTGTAWIRHLLEHLTYIQTGSVYNNKDDLEFQGESDCPSADNMMVVETHEFGTGAGHVFKPECRRAGIQNIPYTSAIYIVRNPFNTIANDFYSKIRSFQSDTMPEEFSSSQWKQVVRQQTKQWLHHVTWWLSTFKGRLHVVFYENMIADPFWEMYKIIRFIDHPVTLHSLKCFRKTVDYNYYTENERWMSHSKLFVPATTEEIRSAVKVASPVLTTYNISSELLATYLSFDELH